MISANPVVFSLAGRVHTRQPPASIPSGTTPEDTTGSTKPKNGWNLLHNNPKD